LLLILEWYIGPEEEVTFYLFETEKGKRSWDINISQRVRSIGLQKTLAGPVKAWEFGGELPKHSKKVS